MSKTSDRTEVLSVAIARHFEKEPDLPSTIDDDTPDCSPKGYWVLRSRPNWHWAPMFKVTDAAYAMKLLKELLAKRSIAFNCVGYSPMEIEVFGVGRFAIDVSLELAIAEAVAKAFNLEVG